MNDLFKKIDQSISLIWQYSAAANATENCGYTVCFSGGKDSQVLLDLFKLSGVQFKAVYYVTTIDPMMGSQSSRIAAYAYGCDFAGCEIDKDFFDSGNKRFEEWKNTEPMDDS